MVISKQGARYTADSTGRQQAGKTRKQAMTTKQIRRAAIRANLFLAIARGNKLNSQQLIALRRMTFDYND